jgi:SAM-dependent methyltransferase
VSESVRVIIARLQAMADVAVRHAAEFHRLRLGNDPAALSDVDRVLAAERALAAKRGAGDAMILTPCYGAWFGQLLVRHLGGQWVGLHDAVAPRVALDLAQVSPMDAVERCLTQPSAPTLAACFAQGITWRAPSVERASVLKHNAECWDGMAQDRRFIGDEVVPDRAAAEDQLDPWLLAEGVADKRVLCLAAGGGRHGPLLARAGATVTVLDLSPAQLAIDQRLATANDLRLTTVLGSIDDLPATFPSAAFDIVVQPVSSSYVRDLAPVHAGLAYVLRPGGVLVAQHKQPASLQAHAQHGADAWSLQSFHIDGLPLPAVSGHEHREDGTQEFLHTLDALIGGLCRAGFVIEDLSEPTLGDAWAPPDSAEHRAAFLPPYLKLKARRR